jgi:hypothetical protein
MNIISGRLGLLLIHEKYSFVFVAIMIAVRGSG